MFRYFMEDKKEIDKKDKKQKEGNKKESVKDAKKVCDFC